MSTPLFLKNYFSIDPVINPSTWSFFTFIASGLELGIRFPLETVLRRAQIATFTSPALRQKGPVKGSTKPSKADVEAADVETVVPTPKTYRGVIGTMWSIVYEEGEAPSETGQAYKVLGKQNVDHQNRPGQGVKGLYRGWRVGMWGLAGIWGAGYLGAAIGGGDEDIVTSAPGSGIRAGLGGRPRAF
jgi:fusion and transport protein UGO1